MAGLRGLPAMVAVLCLGPARHSGGPSTAQAPNLTINDAGINNA